MAILDRNISAKSFGFDKSKLQEMCITDKTQAHFLYRVGGMATSTKVYKDPNNEGEVGEGLRGQFRAVDKDGVTIDSAVCYLPGYINEQVIAALEVAQSQDRSAGVQFGYDIYARYDLKSATSYVFVAEDIAQKLGGGNAADRVFAAIDAPMPGGPAIPALEDKAAKSK